MDHNFSPYEKLLELEVNILHLQHNQDELIRQHRDLARTVEKITQHIQHTTTLLQTLQLMHNDLECRVRDQEQE